MNPKAVGEVSEGVVLAHLIKSGMSVSVPFGNNQRYDFIVDDGTRLLKAQVKTGRIVNGCVEFRAYSKNGFTGETRHYKNQIDIFLVYCPQTGQIFKIPVDAVGETAVRLRVQEARGGSKSNIRWARDFEI